MKASVLPSLPFFVLAILGFLAALMFDVWFESQPGSVVNQVAFLKNHNVSFTLKVLLYVIFSFLTIALWIRIERIAASTSLSVLDSLKCGVQRLLPGVVTVAIIGGGLWLSILILEKGGVIGKGVGWVVGFAVMVFGIIYFSAVIVDGRGPYNGLRESLKLIRSHWWHVAGVYMYVLTTFLVLTALGSVIGFLVLGSLGQVVGTLILYVGFLYVLFLLVMMEAAVSIVVYQDLKRRADLLEPSTHTEFLNTEAIKT